MRVELRGETLVPHISSWLSLTAWAASKQPEWPGPSLRGSPGLVSQLGSCPAPGFVVDWRVNQQIGVHTLSDSTLTYYRCWGKSDFPSGPSMAA